MKKILYVDMDGVLCDYKSAFIEARQRTPEIIYPQSQLGFFMNLKPLPMAYDMDMYFKIFDTYILTRPSVKNPLCYTEKRLCLNRATRPVF
jgi:5'-nucleotidase